MTDPRKQKPHRYPNKIEVKGEWDVVSAIQFSSEMCNTLFFFSNPNQVNLKVIYCHVLAVYIFIYA